MQCELLPVPLQFNTQLSSQQQPQQNGSLIQGTLGDPEDARENLQHLFHQVYDKIVVCKSQLQQGVSAPGHERLSGKDAPTETVGLTESVCNVEAAAAELDSWREVEWLRQAVVSMHQHLLAAQKRQMELERECQQYEVQAQGQLPNNRTVLPLSSEVSNDRTRIVMESLEKISAYRAEHHVAAPTAHPMLVSQGMPIAKATVIPPSHEAVPASPRLDVAPQTALNAGPSELAPCFATAKVLPPANRELTEPVARRVETASSRLQSWTPVHGTPRTTTPIPNTSLPATPRLQSHVLPPSQMPVRLQSGPHNGRNTPSMRSGEEPTATSQSHIRAAQTSMHWVPVHIPGGCPPALQKGAITPCGSAGTPRTPVQLSSGELSPGFCRFDGLVQSGNLTTGCVSPPYPAVASPAAPSQVNSSGFITPTRPLVSSAVSFPGRSHWLPGVSSPSHEDAMQRSRGHSSSPGPVRHRMMTAGIAFGCDSHEKCFTPATPRTLSATHSPMPGQNYNVNRQIAHIQVVR